MGDGFLAVDLHGALQLQNLGMSEVSFSNRSLLTYDELYFPYAVARVQRHQAHYRPR